MKDALLRTSVATLAARSFAKQLRASSTDRYSANLSAENSIAVERYSNTKSKPHYLCEVHRSAGCHTKVFSIPELATDVSGMIHDVLS